MSNTEQAVRSVMIPISDGYLLLPSAMVAEVLRLQETEVQDSLSNTLQGRLNWRNQDVPLVSLEQLSGLAPATNSTDPRIVVLYGIQESLPFFAINSTSAPKIISVTADMLQNPEQLDDLPGVVAKLVLDGQTVYLPEVDYLQEAVLAA